MLTLRLLECPFFSSRNVNREGLLPFCLCASRVVIRAVADDLFHLWSSDFFMECGCAGGFEVSGGALETARGARALPGVNLVNLVRILRTLFAHASLSVDRAVSLRGAKRV